MPPGNGLIAPKFGVEAGEVVLLILAGSLTYLSCAGRDNVWLGSSIPAGLVFTTKAKRYRA